MKPTEILTINNFSKQVLLPKHVVSFFPNTHWRQLLTFVSEGTICSNETRDLCSTGSLREYGGVANVSAQLLMMANNKALLTIFN